MDSSIYHDPHPDVDFVYPCMRCAQRVVLSDSLMTGSNICSFNKDVPCAYCFLQKDVCLPVSHRSFLILKTRYCKANLTYKQVPPELHCLVQNIVNLVDALDAGNLSANDRLVLVEKGLALGKELRAKWSCYQKKSKKRISADGNGNGNKDEDWIAQNSIFLELTRDAAARQEHTNALLEQQNALLTKQTALLDQLSEKQATQLDRVTELMHQLVSDQAKYCQQMISQPALNVGSLSQGKY